MRVIVGIAVFFILNVAGNGLIGPTRCSDGWASPSIGKQGACSHHGGVNRAPQSAVFMVSILGGVIAAIFVGNNSDNRSDQNKRHPDRSHPSSRGTREIDHSGPNCPICGSGMVSRVARKGRHQGQEFYGCSKFPRCKGIVSKTESE